MATATQAQLVDIVWGAGGRFETTVSVAPGKFAEVCGQLAKGQSVTWSFKSNRPMNFNIHYHEGKRVVFPAKQAAAARAQGKLAITLNQDYCWMWENTGRLHAELRLQLAR